MLLLLLLTCNMSLQRPHRHQSAVIWLGALLLLLRRWPLLPKPLACLRRLADSPAGRTIGRSYVVYAYDIGSLASVRG
jgi:hypothetical protein